MYVGVPLETEIELSDEGIFAQELDEEEGGEEEELPEAKVPKADVGDLRELPGRKTDPLGSSPRPTHSYHSQRMTKRRR